MAYALYYATLPPPKRIDHEALQRLVPVHFSTQQDAMHAAALVMRGGQHVWLIEGPDLRIAPEEIEKRCRPMLEKWTRKS
ncbi:MAG: hypothetical protein K0R40_136 [Burkholderiales bacterium]|nr:hypothetical protein [Burkholderiales bacterium]